MKKTKRIIGFNLLGLLATTIFYIYFTGYVREMNISPSLDRFNEVRAHQTVDENQDAAYKALVSSIEWNLTTLGALLKSALLFSGIIGLVLLANIVLSLTPNEHGWPRLTKKNLLFTCLALVVAVFIINIPRYFYFFINKCKCRAYHNAYIETLQSEVTEIRIESLLHKQNHDHPKRSILVTDPDKIEYILSHLKLPLQFNNSGPIFHKCAGHIMFTFRTDSGYLNVQYDHGNGIYPLVSAHLKDDHVNNPGFLYLSSSKTEQLNAYLLSEGFTKNEIDCD